MSGSAACGRSAGGFSPRGTEKPFPERVRRPAFALQNRAGTLLPGPPDRHLSALGRTLGSSQPVRTLLKNDVVLLPRDATRRTLSPVHRERIIVSTLQLYDHEGLMFKARPRQIWPRCSADWQSRLRSGRTVRPRSRLSIASTRTPSNPPSSSSAFAVIQRRSTRETLTSETYKAVGDFRRDSQVWLKLADALDSGEMPPKGSEQPSTAVRSVLRGWVSACLDAEAALNRRTPGRS